MVTTVLRVEKKSIEWIEKNIINNFDILGLKLTDSQKISIALAYLKSYVEEKEFRIDIDEKTKCIRIIGD